MLGAAIFPHFSVAEAFMLGTMVAKFDAEAILIAVGACAAVSLALTLFAMQSKWDFTACGGRSISDSSLALVLDL